MKPIRVFKFDLTFLYSEIDTYQSLIFERGYYKPGSFTLVINKHLQYADTLQKGRLIMLGADEKKAGIITHKEIELDEAGKASENWTVKGKELSGVLGRRITIPPEGQAYDSLTDNAETIIHQFVNNNVVNPADADRKITQLTFATDEGKGDSIFYQTRYKNLVDELEKISKVSGLGWRIKLDLDNEQWIFEVYEGKDLTTEQATNPPVIFSPDFDALSNLRFIDSDIDYRNVGYTAGQGEGANRDIVEVGSETGLSRREVFFDARDIEDSGNLASRGEQRLSEHEQEFYLEGEILEKSSFKYEKDYNLGDIVTVQNKDWGVTKNTRITKITEIYEEGQPFQLSATFDNSVPTLIDKVKDELDQPLTERPDLDEKADKSEVDAHKVDYANHGNLKNKLINGNFDIWQRGTSFNEPSSGDYVADRWLVRSTAFSEISKTDLLCSNGEKVGNALKMLFDENDTSYWRITQMLEITDYLKGKTVTASALVRSNYGNFNFSLRDEGFSGDLLIEKNINYTDEEWHEINITFTLPNDLNGLQVLIDRNDSGYDDENRGANDYIEIAQLQLEEGEYATPFEHRPIGLELALCQRYFCKTYDIDVEPGSNEWNGIFRPYMYTSNNVDISVRWQFPVLMRTTPSIIVYSRAGDKNKIFNETQDTIIDSDYLQTTTNSVLLRPDSNNDFEEGDRLAFHATADAEL